MNAVLYLAPSIEPITLDEFKAHANIERTDQDDFLEGLIKAAREQVENILHRVLITQTWEYWLDGFPTKNYIELPFGKLQSITSLAYTDTAGTVTTMVATTEYLADTYSDPGRIVLPHGVTWPSGSLHPMNPIKCRFICGYGATADTVPASIRAAIKILATHLYETRELVSVGPATIALFPFTVDSLLQSYRLWSF